MKKLSLILSSSIVLSSYAQTIGTFTSVQPGTQVQQLILPSTHTFQLLVKNGDLRTDGLAMKGWHDFTGYIPKAGSSTDGYIILNQEIGGYNGSGGVSMVRLHFNNTSQLWLVDSINQVDFSALDGTYGNCSGGVTPWGTGITAEEDVQTADPNLDGYNKNGFLVEIEPATAKIKDFGNGPQKLWAMGCIDHENVAIKSDGTVAYTGADKSAYGYVYKFIPDVANNLSEGKLFVMKKTTNSTADWIQVPNTTKVERNTTNTLAQGLGATNFYGPEDIEIGPDGKVYFTEKVAGIVYRFNDNGTNVTNFEAFVDTANYTVDYGSGQQTIPWGNGCDNLAFDGEGNLWVLQDGAGASLAYNYIWMVKPGHTAANPKVELFARTPLSCEPTGITFSPDYKFMFLSIQHPNSANLAKQIDAAGDTINFNTHSTIVIARKENLGKSITVAVPKLVNGNIVSLFPNPINKGEVINLSYEISEPQNIQIELFDMKGALKLSLRRSAVSGTNNFMISTGDFSSGTYLLHTTGSNGFESKAKLTIK